MLPLNGNKMKQNEVTGFCRSRDVSPNVQFSILTNGLEKKPAIAVS